MKQVVLDNATLSSTFRALGFMSVPDRALLDVEHAALGRFVEAVVLADKVIVPSTYIEKYQGARKQALEHDCFVHETVPEDEGAAIQDAADTYAPEWFDAFYAASQRGTFAAFLEQTQAFAQFVWQHSSSQFFLVFRALGVEKKSPLLEAFFASNGDWERGKALNFRAPSGEPVAWQSLSRHVQKMASVLAWLGDRFLWHQIFAARHGAIYLPHPMRDFFAHDFMFRAGTFRPSPSSALGRSFGLLQTTLSEQMTALGRSDAARELHLPYLLPLVTSMAGPKRTDFMAAIIELRGDKHVIQLRELLQEIETEQSLGVSHKYKQLSDDVSKTGMAVLRERKLDQRYVKFAPSTTLHGIQADGIAEGIRTKIPAALFKQVFFGRRYRVFLKRVMDEIAQVATLGTLKDTLNGYAWIDDKNQWGSSGFYTRPVQFGLYERDFKSAKPPDPPKH